MKVSHELPLSLMHNAYKWNDYDYCLPHLIDQYDQYRIFFQKSRLDKRFIIMDNGLFENVVHTTEDLLDKINLVHPNIFIAPDAWNDANTTLVNAKSWMINYKAGLPEGVNLMAVCQGKDMTELITTYQTLVDLGYTHIAFNHSSVAYQQECKGMDHLKAAMYGRMEFIRRLVEKNIIRKDIYHHLLGASDWKEFQAYTEYNFIKSVDTSSPIINGALGIKFNYDGNYIKPKQKLEDIMELNLDNKLDIIKYNVDIFRKSIS
jgi:hypothetical protein